MTTASPRPNRQKCSISSQPVSGRIGLDIGRVIISPASAGGRADTSFLSGGEERALRTPPSPDAFRVIRRLIDRYGGNVWLVSKCGPRIEGRTRRWLDFQDFYAETGLSPGHLRFCRRRPDKRQHCAALGITHFVDDRLDVLQHLHALVPHLYLFGHQRRRERIPDWSRTVEDWKQVEAELLPDTSILGGPDATGTNHPILGLVDESRADR